MWRTIAALVWAGGFVADAGAPGLADVERQGRPVPILVSAAVSLTEALEEVARDFERRTGGAVVLNFGPSSGLARQALEGARVDVFISADDAQMDRLEQAGRLAVGSRVALLSNQLVVMVLRGGPIVKTAADLTNERIRRIAIGDPAGVPAGVYARAYLERAGVWSLVSAKVVPLASVRAALAALEAGNADAAIVYRTDARTAAGAQVALEVPIGQAPRIVYPAALVREGPNPEGAARFLEFLRGHDARAVFERHGFVTP
jgi:molybdate transport system substrate-binding protein